nr:baseplate J/gp47 family protein [Spirochaetota bacterium]
PIGIRIKLDAWAIDRQWALAEEVYYSLWINTAEGVSLDRVTRLGFVSRDPAQHAIVVLEFEGLEGSVIPIGSQAETVQNIVFETIEEKIIDASGIVHIYAQCTQSGTTGNVPAASITSIKTPISGVDSVINPAAASGGRPRESDPELRSSYEDMPASTGSSIDAIRGIVAGLPGVINTIANENTGNTEDANGLPPRSIEVVVIGGIDTDIANAIFTKKSAGIETFGSTLVVVTDSQGLSHNIRFSRPTAASVYVTYEVAANSEWSADSIAIMKRKAIAYIGGVDDQSVEYNGVGIGGRIAAWKLIAIQSDVGGINNLTVKLGRAPDPTDSENLTFLIREFPRAAMANIVVNVI